MNLENPKTPGEALLGIATGVAILIVAAAGIGAAVGVYSVVKCWIAQC